VVKTLWQLIVQFQPALLSRLPRRSHSENAHPRRTIILIILVFFNPRETEFREEFYSRAFFAYCGIISMPFALTDLPARKKQGGKI